MEVETFQQDEHLDELKTILTKFSQYSSLKVNINSDAIFSLLFVPKDDKKLYEELHQENQQILFETLGMPWFSNVLSNITM